MSLVTRSTANDWPFSRSAIQPVGSQLNHPQKIPVVHHRTTGIAVQLIITANRDYRTLPLRRIADPIADLIAGPDRRPSSNIHIFRHIHRRIL
jgi:hypothetical protein